MASLLVLTVLLPLIGCVVLFARPQLSTHSARSLALGITLATLGLSLLLLFAFQSQITGPQFSYVGRGGKLGLEWLPQLGVRFARWGSTGSASGCSC